MLSALLLAVVVFAASFVALMAVEKLIHRWTYNPDRSYRWGVWLFSSLFAVYAFVTALGR
ncbi:MAG TPA: hypothetical protein VLI05_03025 [Candidatus Saccharimonadia bacterium]|nr:hypothetical protein [Candidatus Saccharimonadia bacterium]